MNDPNSARDIERLLDQALAGRRTSAHPSLTDVHRRVRHLRRRSAAVKTSGLLAVGAGAVALIAVRDPGATPVGDAPSEVPCDTALAVAPTTTLGPTLTTIELLATTTTDSVPVRTDGVIVGTTVHVTEPPVDVTTIPFDPTTTAPGIVPAAPTSTTIIESLDTGPATTTIAPDGIAPTTTDCVPQPPAPTTSIVIATTIDATLMPNLVGLTSEEVSRVLYDELALDVVANTIVDPSVDAVNAAGERFVVSEQTPAPGTPLVAGQTVEVIFVPTGINPAPPAIPAPATTLPPTTTGP